VGQVFTDIWLEWLGCSRTQILQHNFIRDLHWPPYMHYNPLLYRIGTTFIHYIRAKLVHELSNVDSQRF